MQSRTSRATTTLEGLEFSMYQWKLTLLALYSQRGTKLRKINVKLFKYTILTDRWTALFSEAYLNVTYLPRNVSAPLTSRNDQLVGSLIQSLPERLSRGLFDHHALFRFLLCGSWKFFAWLEICYTLKELCPLRNTRGCLVISLVLLFFMFWSFGFGRLMYGWLPGLVFLLLIAAEDIIQSSRCSVPFLSAIQMVFEELGPYSLICRSVMSADMGRGTKALYISHILAFEALAT